MSQDFQAILDHHVKHGGIAGQMSQDFRLNLNALCAGKVVLLSTDTVYGLAAIPTKTVCKEISRLKGRDETQAIAWLVNKKIFYELAECIAPYVEKLINKFWPGALTLVVKASKEALKCGCVAENGTLAMRMPNNDFCLELVDAIDKPLACTSANKHGRPAPYELEQIDKEFQKFAIGGLAQSCPNKQASTIIDCTGRLPALLREGYIKIADIESVCGLNVKLDFKAKSTQE